MMKKSFLFLAAMAVSGFLFARITVPVNFGTMDVQFNGSAIEISWSTLSEANNDYFIIERSTDSVNFVTIGNLSGAGNSSIAQHYLFTDTNVAVGEDYCYRIKQLDYDGSFSYSPQTCYALVQGTNDVPETASYQVRFYPNPAKDILIVSTNIRGDYSGSITDMAGKVMMNLQFTRPDSEINISELPAGTYFLKIGGAENSGSTQKKFIVLK